MNFVQKIIIVSVTVLITTFSTYYFLIGHVYVERKVFENSYQYIESKKTELFILENSLSEIDRELKENNLDEEVKNRILTQRKNLVRKIEVAKDKINNVNN